MRLGKKVGLEGLEIGDLVGLKSPDFYDKSRSETPSFGKNP
jgi:hypothetical protein